MAAGAGSERPPLAGFLDGVRDREPGAVADRRGLGADARPRAGAGLPRGRSRTGSCSAARWRRSIRWWRRGSTPTSAATQEASFPVPAISIDDAERGSAFGAACMLHQRYLSLEGQRGGEGERPVREDAPRAIRLGCRCPADARAGGLG